MFCREMESRPPIIVKNVHPCIILEERLDDVRMSFVTGNEERGPSVRGLFIECPLTLDWGHALEHFFQNVRIPLTSTVVEHGFVGLEINHLSHSFVLTQKY